MCTYNGKEVMSMNPSQENCNTIYRANTHDGSTMYTDGYSFNLMAIYEGEGTWDSSNSICLYNGNPVFDFNQTPITSEENCGTVYNLKPYVGQDFYVSMFELLSEKGTYTNVQNGGTGIYSSVDDIGKSYYFRGNMVNNYVKFGKYTEDAYSIYDTTTGTSNYASICTASDTSLCTKIASANDDMYWRIVRINGDGTIRMVYAGTRAYANNDDGEALRNIGESSYNINDTDNAYVGYMYGTVPSTTYDEAHTNTHYSSIKSTIDNWYEKYINTNYGLKIADAIYCNDRTIVTDKNKLGTMNITVVGGFGSTLTLYGFFNRANMEKNIVLASLKCEREEDRFTKEDIVNGVVGNSKLTYPVALLTADELMYAGGLSQSSTGNYTYDSQGFWTLTPFANVAIDSSAAYVPFMFLGGEGFLYIDFFGGVYMEWVESKKGVRPVISLKPDTLKYDTETSNGSKEHPFILK